MQTKGKCGSLIRRKQATVMELLDNESDDDIFSPAATQSKTNLGVLFNPEKANDAKFDSSSLQFQAPTKDGEIEHKTSANKNGKMTGSGTSFSCIISAFAWDGKSYKLMGKLAMALVARKESLSMVLYRSKVKEKLYPILGTCKFLTFFTLTATTVGKI